MTAPERSRRARRLRTALFALTALYGFAALGAYALLVFAADRAWFGTLFLFGPRWLLLVPAAVLAVAALALRKPRVLVPIALAALAVVGPVMGFEVAVGAGDDAPAGAPSARVATFNVGARRLDDPEIAEVVRRVRPDVVALQEVHPGSLKGELVSPVEGYSVHCDVQNCLLSRFPITKARARGRDDVWARGGSGAIALYDLDGGELGPVHVLHVHLETAREGLEAVLRKRIGGIGAVKENIETRRWESNVAREFLADAGVDTSRLIVVGDFNMPVESAIYRDKWGDFENAFTATGTGFGFTKHTRLLGARIDHVLVGSNVHTVDAWVDDGGESDHKPMVADVWLTPAEAPKADAVSAAKP